MHATTILPTLAQYAAAAGDETSDFRAHVWIAYALVLAFLAAFTLWTLLKLGKVEGRCQHLVERFEKKHPDEKES